MVYCDEMTCYVGINIAEFVDVWPLEKTGKGKRTNIHPNNCQKMTNLLEQISLVMLYFFRSGCVLVWLPAEALYINA